MTLGSNKGGAATADLNQVGQRGKRMASPQGLKSLAPRNDTLV